MNRNLLVCDLDNTLYDWVNYFVTAFYAMVDEAVRVMGCDRETLLDDLRTIHRLHHDSEHPFALLDTATVQKMYLGRSRREMSQILNEAFHAFNSNRKEHLRVYPGVREGLDALSAAGVTLVAHTESRLYSAVDRLSRLDLTRYFERIYCRERPVTEHPDVEVGAKWLERFPMTRVRELSHHQRKPSPEVLLEICQDLGVDPDRAAYVGDSMARDMFMAQRAGVFSIWAKYGTALQTESYQKLVRITHWTEEDVHRERTLAEQSKNLKPDFVLERSFDQIIGALREVPGSASPRMAHYH